MDQQGPIDGATPVEHVNARLRVLAETSQAFANVATDYQQLIETVARTTADLVGDGCNVTLIAEDGETLFNAASAHRDREIEASYREYLAKRGVSKTTSQSVAAAVARTGEPKLVESLDPDVLVAQTDEALKPLVARLNVHSFAVVPIRARGMIIGTLSLLRSSPGIGYTTDDLLLLLDVAARAGLAIENARLYRDLESRVRQRTAELELLNRDLEAFSHSVAHDLRAPVRRIHRFAGVILDDFGDSLPSGARPYLARVTDAARELGQLIDALIELSRVTQAQLHREPVDLSALANRVITRLREGNPERAITVTIEPTMNTAADPRLVEVVLTNLIGNAWKFTSKRESPLIAIGVEPRENASVFYIRDNGAGFDPRLADNLFEVFQRLHSPAEFDGSGIGLATVRRIVDRHGGDIWAEAEVDRGATFFFTLERV